jgi:nicotinic acid mononucleotide adenylyltransferase
VVDLRGRWPVGDAIPSNPSVIFVDAPTPDVSSTVIRRRLADGLAIADLVPNEVARHIARHRLYQPPDGGKPLA